MTDENKGELRIFSYGILKRYQMLLYFLEHYDIDSVTVTPDIAKGFTCYFSTETHINYALPADERYCIPGAVLEFHGDQVKLDRLKKAMDRIEAFYSQMKVKMSDGKEAVIYVVFNSQGFQKGMVGYKDAIMDKQTIINPRRARDLNNFSFHPDDNLDQYYT